MSISTNTQQAIKAASAAGSASTYIDPQQQVQQLEVLYSVGDKQILSDYGHKMAQVRAQQSALQSGLGAYVQPQQAQPLTLAQAIRNLETARASVVRAETVLEQSIVEHEKMIEQAKGFFSTQLFTSSNKVAL